MATAQPCLMQNTSHPIAHLGAGGANIIFLLFQSMVLEVIFAEAVPGNKRTSGNIEAGGVT